MKTFILKNWPIILILLLSGLVVWPVFRPGYFFHHDDLQVMRIFEMRQCFRDFQIPCRWVPDMGFGNGFPLFNYYSVLPYYIGAVLSYPLTFIDAAKALFFIPLVLGGISMYLLGKELFGKVPGFVAATLYLFAPYRALDSFTRGAISESFAIAIIPLVFYFLLLLIKERNLKFFLGASLSLGAFLLSHNLMTLIFSPVLFSFTLYFLIKTKFRNAKQVLLSFILGVGLSAFFLIPAFFEQNLIQAYTLTILDFDFRGHFATVNQLFFNRDWGYGGSVFGPNDTISFQIGMPHWWMVLLAGLILVLEGFKSLKKNTFIVLLIGLFFVSTFMMHSRSLFVWEMISPLKFMQFPWRFLAISIFSTSLLGGAVFYLLNEGQRGVNRKLYSSLFLIIISATIFLNLNFFVPKDFYYNLTDHEKLTGTLWEIQQQAGILDYLPTTAEEPKGPAPSKPEIIYGRADIENYKVRSNHFSFDLKVTEPNTNIEIPVFDFPNWKVFLNGEYYKHSNDNRLGRIRLDLNEGEYKVYGKFEDTPLRTLANSFTIIAVIGLLVVLTYGRKKQFI